MIKVNNLHKEFEGFKALDGVNLHVEKGSVYGLVGPNGAGKTTLIKHLTGVYKQNEGTVLVDNEEVFDNSAIKERIVYISDDLFFLNKASINTMMKFYKNIYTNFDYDRFVRLGNVFTGLNKTMPICRMSKGMQKQAAFWLALCCSPDVLILDEPVDGLDPVMRKQVWSLLLQDVSERHTTVLVSSHNLRELEDVCDTVGIMNKGKVLLERSLSSLQGSVMKYQVAFNGDLPELEDKLDVLHLSRMGSVYSLIIRGDRELSESVLNSFSPVLLDVIPLTLEEIFIYELGGENYEIKDIIL